MACKSCEERRRAVKIVTSQLRNGFIHPVLVIIVVAWAVGMMTAAAVFTLLN